MKPRLRWRRRIRTALSRLPIVGVRWDPVARRRWLLERLPSDSVGAEIGVWKGDFSAAILATVRPRMLHLIDPWRSAADVAHARTLYDTAQDKMDSIHRGVLRRFEREILDGQVVVHRSISVEAAAEIPEAGLDWVYVDGDHTYEGVKVDIATYRQKVRPGGLVAGDDFVEGGMFESAVKRAVDEAVASGQLTLVIQRDRQFLLRRPEASTDQGSSEEVRAG